MRFTALIPARSGSKGLPGKNIKSLAGKPLIQWTVGAALASSYVSETIVSTDDDTIAVSARLAGANVPFLRPADLSTDTARSADVVLHALDYINDCDYIVLLQPTSPLRTAFDIDKAIELMLSNDATSCVSLCPTSKHPEWMYTIDRKDKLESVLNENHTASSTNNRRQDLAPVYVLNGAIYISKLEEFKRQKTFINQETIGYVMPVERSIDIDSHLDFKMAEYLMETTDNVN